MDAKNSLDELSARIENLEMKISEQDRFIDDLNSVIIDQNKKIDLLELKIKKIEEAADKASAKNNQKNLLKNIEFLSTSINSLVISFHHHFILLLSIFQ